MFAPPLAPTGPWTLDLLVVAGNAWSGAERRAISRGVERGLLLRLLPGVYVDRLAFGSLSPEGRHVVRMRAVGAVSRGPVLFSHWSAAVLHGLPVLLERLGSVHVTIAEDDDRHRTGVSAHRFLVEGEEVVRFGALTATGVGRTVVDVAGAAPLEEGVMAADGALLAGVPRALLEAAVDLAGARRASRRTMEAIGIAHPGAESAAESRMRVALMRAGFEVPELQHPIRLRSGTTVFLDALLPIARAGIEVDGRAKYLDPSMAPDGAGAAVLAEKDREDEVRLGLRSLVRPGWHQTGGPAAMRSLLGRVDVLPTRPRTPMTEYAAAARSARPRFATAHPKWRA